MSKKYRVGIIGFGHMHINNIAAQFSSHPQIQWVACADTVPATPELRMAPYTREWNMKKALANFNIPKSYDHYEEMIEKERFDIMIVTSENALHPQIVTSCAKAGINVYVEKPMAINLSEAFRMVRACEASGTVLLVGWPSAFLPAVNTAKAMIDEGVIGRILEVKYRSGHKGPLGSGVTHKGVNETTTEMSGNERAATWWHQSEMGGGVMLDFCSYGVMFANWYIGEPAVAASGLKANLDSQWGNTEDNAVILARFPSAMALIEGSWTTLDHGVPVGPIIYGTKGTLVLDIRTDIYSVRLERGGDQTKIHKGEPLPPGRDSLPAEFIHHLETGAPLHTMLDVMFNLEVMSILDAGIRSATSGKLELVENRAWEIG